MKILFNLYTPKFLGQRQDRNTVAQLKENNNYDLNYPNRRKINKAIDNLSQIPDDKNIEFLLDISKNLKYGTKIDLGKQPYNDWRTKLINATDKAIKMSDSENSSKYLEELNKIKSDNSYSQEEKELLKLRESLLGKIDFKQIDKLDKSNIKNIKNNLDYFIVSSEVPLLQKLYILNRLNYFMSDDYKIEPQLADKKNQALAEMINDIVVDTPESQIPNIKEINQLHHGICGAISMCRKMLAYEDKANYIDMLLSELDADDNMMVYDRNKLGTNTKIPIPKVKIDYKEALERGYRIVDTSAMNWMQVANTDITNELIGVYNPIDSVYYDTFTDSNFLVDISPELENEHDFYRSLVKAKSIIGNYKAELEKQKYFQLQDRNDKAKTFELEHKYNSLLLNTLYELANDNITNEQVRKTFNDLKSLELATSSDKDKIKDYRKEFVFLSNEEQEIKEAKIEKFLQYKFPEQDAQNIKKLSKDILEIIETINTISGKKSNAISQKIIKARDLYNVAAAFRTSKQLQLNIQEFAQAYMQKYNIKDNESNLADNIDFLIKQLQNGTLKPEIKEQLAANFEIENNDEVLEEYLKEMKQQVQTITTEVFDNLYNSIVLLDRRKALAIQVENIQQDINSNKDKNIIEDISKELGVPKNINAINDKLQDFMDILNSSDCTEEQYLDIFNKLGFKSQLLEFKYNIEKIADLMFVSGNENIIRAFNLLNNIPKDAPIEETQQKFREIADYFNKISQLLTQYQNMLYVENANGDILNTTNMKHLILKHLENSGEIPTTQELNAFHRRFNQIDKLLANKENNIHRYSDLPKSYTTFTPLEKEALQKYQRSVNVWYSTIKKEHINLYRQLREPLENLHREIGLKDGFYWSPDEGHSGLTSPQEVKIIEHMTDRPYYIEKDGEKSIEKIKDGVYSGISTTSVSHKQPAMHAQYIADVEPVETKDGANEILFHDNTWGASEHKQVWIDGNGLERTDYSNEYGGELGFITNNKYLNGNLTQNILNKAGTSQTQDIPSKKYRKITGSSHDEVYKFPLLSDIITAGISPSAIHRATNIKNNFLISPYGSLDKLITYTQEMTQAEIFAAIERNKNVASNFYTKYDDFLERINGNDVFDKGIKTKEAYDELDDNDNVKITLEKVAILKSYENITLDTQDFVKCKNLQALEKFKNKIPDIARKDFNYAFAKDYDILKYISYSSRESIKGLLQEFSKENHLKIKDTDINSLIKKMMNVNSNDFNGSMKDTIDLLSLQFKQNVQKHTPNFADKSEKIEILTQQVKKILRDNNYMTLKDKLNNLSYANWIDKTFNPRTDEEFVGIFNKLRDMTTEDFSKLYNSKITNKDLGIKNYSGYDILKEILSQKETTLTSLRNQIYLQEYYNDVKANKTEPEYQYNKFLKTKTNSAIYKKGKLFDEICSEYYADLSNLNIEKYIKPYKQQYYERYGVFPAFPTIQLSSDENLTNAMDALYSDINDNIGYINVFKIQKRLISLIDTLYNNSTRYNNSNDIMTKKQFSVNKKYLLELEQLCQQDETMQDFSNKISALLNSQNVSLSEYKQLITELRNEIYKYEKTVSGNSMDEEIQYSLKNIKIKKHKFIENLFDKKYRSKALALLNNWISLKSQSELECDCKKAERKAQEADMCYSKFVNFYKKHKILQTPENILEEYMLLNAKDSEMNNPEVSEDKKKELSERNNLLKTALQGLLMKSNILDLQYMIQNCLKRGDLNHVAKVFQDLQIELTDGSHIPLTSPEGLNLILSPLFDENTLDVLAQFLNKMNLSEKIIEILTAKDDFVEAKARVKRMHSILSSADKQAKFIISSLNNLPDLDKEEDYLQIIEDFRDKIIKYINKTNYRSVKQIYNAAIDDAIKQIEISTKIPKNMIFSVNLKRALSNVSDVVQQDIQIRNRELERISLIQELITKLKLPANSQYNSVVDNYNDKCADLIEYQNQFRTEYPNIGLHSDN